MKIDGIIQMQKQYLIETIKAMSLNHITFRGSDIKENCTTIFLRKKPLGED